MAPVGLKHWMLHNDQLAHELDETLKLSPGYDPVRDVDPALTFHAPLLTGPDSIPGAIRAIVQRNSEGTYQAPRGAFLLSAPDNASRHEYTADDEPLGVLMEPASTNKCINHNADAQAENMFLGGDPSATLTYVNDAEELNRAGLDRVAGKVYRLNNSTGTEFARANPLGECENTNPHTVLAYWRGTGQGEIRLSGSGAGPESVPTHYELETNLLTPTAPTNGLEVRAQPGADIYFILNQLEESEVKSSAIITKGAATSRAVDQLSWPLVGDAGSILNQSEGMGALIYQPKAGFEAQGSNNTRHLTLGPSASGNAWISHGWSTNVGQLTDGVETVTTSQFYEADDQIVIAWRWGGGTMSISSKRQSVWTVWDSEPYSGSFQIDDTLRLAVGSRFPRNYRDLRIWSVDRGEGWLEDLFEGVAN